MTRPLPLRICLGLPGHDCTARTHRSRCDRCQAEWTRRKRGLYSAAWTSLSKAARAAHPYCSVCGTQEDLTLDHETGLVQCRRHNSSHRGDPGAAAGAGKFS